MLGNTVYPDSSLSPVLQGRVDRAIRLYQDHQVNTIMLSGGTGKELGKVTGYVPEGLAMRLYCLKKGIPADALIEDNHGENTYLSAVDLIALQKERHFESAIVVSSFYHLTRAKYIIGKLGFHNLHSASSDVFFPIDAWGLLREFAAFYKYMIVY